MSKVRSFLVLAEYLHFGRAADALDISQPALSSQIRNLEDTLGVSLFARSTRQMKLTPEGERLAIRMRRIFDDLDDLFEEITDPALNQRRRIIFSCIPSIATNIIPNVIKEFLELHPETTIELFDDPSSSLERRVVSREVDFGIGPMPYWNEELEFTSIIEDQFVVIMRNDCAMANYEHVTIDDISQYPLISYNRGTKVRSLIETQFSRNRIQFAPRYNLVNPPAIGAMVENGLGIAIMPSTVATLMANATSLCFVKLEPRLSRHLGLIKRAGDVLAPEAMELYDAIGREMRRTGLHLHSD